MKFEIDLPDGQITQELMDQGAYNVSNLAFVQRRLTDGALQSYVSANFGDLVEHLLGEIGAPNAELCYVQVYFPDNAAYSAFLESFSILYTYEDSSDDRYRQYSDDLKRHLDDVADDVLQDDDWDGYRCQYEPDGSPDEPLPHPRQCYLKLGLLPVLEDSELDYEYREPQLGAHGFVEWGAKLARPRKDG